MVRTTAPQRFIYEQIHIDAARNSSDDFNLFHDKNKWQRIRDNLSAEIRGWAHQR